MVNPVDETWRSPQWVEHTQLLLDSYERLVGDPLIHRSGNPLEESKRLFEAPFVVVSHGTQADPILNYGNRTALTLWEMKLATFLQTPSRLTAEPDEREERAQMLQIAAQRGYYSNYEGVRISSSGRRFRIERATIWRLIRDEQVVGQAATFSDWCFLEAG